MLDAARWYSPAFTSMATPLTGTRFHGVKEACESAVAAHKQIAHQWLTAVGWDMMVVEDGVVFFEGNYAGARTPRRVYLSLASLLEFTSSYFWPYGQRGTITPSA